MIRPLTIHEWLLESTPIVDVRSPGEFARGHIPGAVNVPLFDDDERAVVGTLYKRAGRDAAMLEGLRITGPKLADLVEQARETAPDGHIRIHCWRGGERSGSMAWLLDKAGFARAHTLIGGYKAFRQEVINSFNTPLDLHVLGGYTGSGKTETLGQLRVLGQQVVDLEALACHKGSAFGALGEVPQPTTEHFENLLWNALRDLEPQRPIWVEDESLMIGRVRIPDAFFHQMRQARLFFAEMPVEQRVERLVVDYGRFAKEDLAASVRRIEKRLGPQHCKAALEALDRNDLHSVARIALVWYDKAYLRGTAERDPQRVVRLPADANDLRGLAQRLKEDAAAHRTGN